MEELKRHMLVVAAGWLGQMLRNEVPAPPTVHTRGIRAPGIQPIHEGLVTCPEAFLCLGFDRQRQQNLGCVQQSPDITLGGATATVQRNLVLGNRQTERHLTERVRRKQLTN